MKKRPRGTWWRWLLAIFLGTGTWWCVRSWQMPAVWFEMTYQTKDALKFAASLLPQFPKVDEAHVHPRWDVRVWDSSNRYMVSMVSYHPDLPKYYDVVDLQSGKMIVQQRQVGTDIDFWNHWHDRSRALPSGDIIGLKYQSSYSSDESTREQLAQKLLNGYVSFRADRQRQPHQTVTVLNTELWSWNALTNEEEYYRTFPDRSTVKICSDSSALLEVERVTAMLPGFLLPASIPNILASQVTAELGLDDLAVMRVWALPAMKLRCSVIKPWMFRQGMAELTSDGAFLVLCDNNLPKGFTSKRFHQYVFSHHGSSWNVDCYATEPYGVQVYDARTGELWWEKSDYAGVYTDYSAVGQDLVQFSKMRDSLLQQPDLLLHLPTKRLMIADNCPSAELLTSRKIQYASLANNDDPGYLVRVASNDGSVQHYQKVQASLQFIRSATQYISRASTQTMDKLPDWFRTWVRERDWARRRFDTYSESVTVTDYAANRTLLSLPLHESTGCRMDLTERWLVVKQEGENNTKITVFSVPFPSWSPWWACIAGLIITILTKRMLNHLAKRSTPASIS